MAESRARLGSGSLVLSLVAALLAISLPAAAVAAPRPRGVAVVVAGLPAGVSADVTVTRAKPRGKPFTRRAAGSATYPRARPGRYVVKAAPVRVGGVTATPVVAKQRVRLGKKRKRVTVTVTYAVPGGPGAPVVPATGWADLAAGGEHNCGVKDNGSLWCWGSNRYGQLATTDRYETLVPTPSPLRVGTATDWISVDAGYAHTCGVRSSGSLWCWGANSAGQSGSVDTSSPALVPVKVGGDVWASVSAGRLTTCGLRIDKSLWCWGSSAKGELGKSVLESSSAVPVQFGTASWADVSVGAEHVCGVAVNTHLYCWGSNYKGQLGVDNSTNADTRNPTPVEPGLGTDGWADVGVGDYFTCATRVNTTLWCWGWNEHGRLGPDAVPTTDSHFAPAQVGGTEWRAVAGGDGQACGIKLDDTLWCWGYNLYGELGSTTNAGTLSPNPTPLPVGSGWRDVDPAGRHTCGLRRDSTLWCWGRNSLGVLGPEAPAGADLNPTPLQVPYL